MADLVRVTVSAPGKIILHGEHSVMFGKTAIAGSLGLRTTITIQEEIAEVPSLNIHLPSIKLETTILLKPVVEKLLTSNENHSWREPHKLNHSTHIHNVETFLNKLIPHFDNLKNNQKNALFGFFYVLSGVFGKSKLLNNSLKIKVESDLMVGAGTGSSASYAVCLAGALVQLAKLKDGLRTTAFSMEDKKIISEWAFKCEKIMHGAPSGIDNSTATFGALVSFRKGEDPQLLEVLADLRVLLVNTNVSRQTSALARKVADLRERNGQAVACVIDAIGHVTDSAIKIMKNLSNSGDAGIEKKYEYLSELWEMNHCLLASLGVSHPALEVIRATAKEHGLACKLTGAGGGGYAIILVPPFTQKPRVDALTDELVEKGFEVTDTRLGGAGVTIDECVL